MGTRFGLTEMKSNYLRTHCRKGIFEISQRNLALVHPRERCPFLGENIIAPHSQHASRFQEYVELNYASRAEWQG